MKFGGFGKEWNGKVNRHQCVSNSVWDLDVASSLSSTVSSASCESLVRMPCGVIACPQSVMPVPRTSKGVAYDSAALSLGLTRDVGEGLDAGNARDKPGISRDEDYESRSGSENGDDQDADNPPRKKRYHRHTPQQIQELEALFKECPHPDEKQRLELSRRLNLETRQVKFWFQNRRTQMKTQLERHENSMLREENEKLRVENMSIREAMRNSICSHCGGPVLLGDMNLEQQQLRTENARLKEELERVAPLAERFLGKAIHSSILQKSSLDLGIGTLNPAVTPFPLPFASNQDHLMVAASAPLATSRMGFGMGLGSGIEKSMMAELAFAAMEEFMKMAQEEGPLWVSSSGSGKLSLNYQEYARQFLSTATPKPLGLATEASRETGIVMMRSSSLVETLMDAERWKEMFPCTISRAAMVYVILPGLGGTRNGALQLMYAELQVLSPLVPSREVYFLRFCKQHAGGVWAVVDVSLDPFRETMSPMQHQLIKCRRLPSGCLIQEISSGSSEITWVEHAEYDDRQVHKLYKSLVGSGMAFGAQRWVATLQRRCEFLASATDITDVGRSSMLKLAQRMVENFCAGVSASTVYAWNRISTSNNAEDDIRLMTRKSVDDPGEPPGVVLSAATSFWLPVSPFRLFEFLRDERLRSEWDILSNGGPMLEMTHISKGPDPGNCVSLLKANAAMNSSQNSMLILQETCTDTSGSLVVYAPVDIPAMRAVLNGGDPAYVALLPSGFAILPDSPEGRMDCVADGETGVGGSLLTVAFQIVVNSLPTAKLNVESVDTVNKLITCTVQKIKAALQCED